MASRAGWYFLLVTLTNSLQSQPQPVVSLFLDKACPLSQTYAPEIARLRQRYANRVLFTTQTNPRDYGVNVTPSVVVTVGGQVKYRGRIDDRAPSLGKLRPNGPTRADLRIALDEMLANQPVTVSETVAVGCAITVPAQPGAASATYARDVAPILNRHCVECHRPGQAGPFPLTSYDEARPRAAAIAQATSARLMPPWKAEPQTHRFQGERRLSSAEVDTLERWAAAGAPAGDLTQAPRPPTFPDRWRLGEPHQIISMPKAFAIPADGPDIYHCFVIPLSLNEVRYVRAFEFRPGNRRALHHALFFIDGAGATARRGADYPCFGVPGFLPSASLGGWTPGFTPAPYPEGAAVTLRPNARLVLQLHYHPTGQPETDRSEIALYFGHDKPTRRMMDVALGSRNIDIPPGETNYLVRDYFTLPVDVEVTGIIPHAHYLAREMRGWAILPGGRRITLLTIRDWDFNWQQHYRYAKPFILPAETRFEMEFRYDNSAANPRNPFSPPRRVVWGPDSTDEMAGLHLQVIPHNDDDARELGQALWGKIMRELGGGIFRRPE